MADSPIADSPTTDCHRTDSVELERVIERQIERCRRLASIMTDDETRNALERLAREYEAKLPRRRRPFMLGDGAGG